MDNKQFSPFAIDLMNLQQIANTIMQRVQTGEGLPIMDEQKAEFKKQWEASGGNANIELLKKNIEQMREKIKEANGTNHKADQ